MVQKAAVLAFFILLCGASLLNYSQMDWSSQVLDRENRLQKPWPEWDWEKVITGQWTADLGDAFADRFIRRNDSMKISEVIKSWYGLPAPEIQLVAAKKGDLFEVKEDAPGAEKKSPEKSGENGQDTGSKVKAPAADGAWVNSFLIIGDRGYETAGYDDPGASYYATAINNLAAALPENVQVFDIVVPSSIEFLDNPKYTKLSYPQTKGITDIYSKFSSRVQGINIIPAMAAHASEYIYHRTDHHWTGLGAYYAYQAAGSFLGYTPFDYKDFPKETLPNFWGTIYNGSRSSALEASPDTVELVYPFMEHTFNRHYSDGVVPGKAVDKAYIEGFNKYLTYIAGDFPWSDIQSSVKNGRKILVLKDSYGNAFIPYLLNHYEEVHILDPRYWNGSVPQFVKDRGIQQVLIFNYYLVISVYTGFARNLVKVTAQ